MSSLPDVRDGKDVLASWVWLDSGSSGGLRARDVGEEIWCCLLAIVPAMEALEMKREWLLVKVKVKVSRFWTSFTSFLVKF